MDGERVRNVDEIENGAYFVAASREKFIRVNYGRDLPALHLGGRYNNRYAIEQSQVDHPTEFALLLTIYLQYTSIAVLCIATVTLHGDLLKCSLFLFVHSHFHYDHTN